MIVLCNSFHIQIWRLPIEFTLRILVGICEVLRHLPSPTPFRGLDTGLPIRGGLAVAKTILPVGDVRQKYERLGHRGFGHSAPLNPVVLGDVKTAQQVGIGSRPGYGEPGPAPQIHRSEVARVAGSAYG